MNTPAIPPKKSSVNWKLWLSLVGLALVGMIVAAVLLIRSLMASGMTGGADNLFGDQYLKTSVALIELHKVRYGRYPAALRDLKFTGQWDQAALLSVRYFPNAEGTHYYVEVVHGWVGKPTLTMPAEFWQGTGYSAALKPGD